LAGTAEIAKARGRAIGGASESTSI